MDKMTHSGAEFSQRAAKNVMGPSYRERLR